jgi:hypothetical protein
MGSVLVDLVGIEPTTSSMLRNDKKRDLTAKPLIVGRGAKTAKTGVFLLPECYQNTSYQFATKLDFGLGLTAGDSPFLLQMIVSLKFI